MHNNSAVDKRPGKIDNSAGTNTTFARQIAKLKLPMDDPFLHIDRHLWADSTILIFTTFANYR